MDHDAAVAALARSLAKMVGADFNADAVKAIRAEIDEAYEAGRNDGRGEADHEIEAAEAKAEAAIEAAAVDTLQVFDACIAAAEGVPRAAEWAADKPNVDGAFNADTARMLARRRPRDYYAHG